MLPSVFLQASFLVFVIAPIVSIYTPAVRGTPVSSDEYNQCDCFMLYEKSPIRYFPAYVSEGLVHSPGYPRGCCSGLNCSYRVEARSGWITRLKVEQFAPACGKDTIIIEERGRTEPHSWDVVDKLKGLCSPSCEPEGVDCSKQPPYSAINKTWHFTGEVRITYSTSQRNVYHGFGLRFQKFHIPGDKKYPGQASDMPIKFHGQLYDYTALKNLLVGANIIGGMCFSLVCMVIGMIMAKIYRARQNRSREYSLLKCDTKKKTNGDGPPPSYQKPYGL